LKRWYLGVGQAGFILTGTIPLDRLMSFFSRHSLSVLLVCRANICRSPMAEALLREELKLRGLHRKVLLDSAGTNATQPGHPADGRAVQACARAGIDLRKSRARQVESRDFSSFDFVLAMDSENRDWLLENRLEDSVARVALISDWVTDGTVGDIPDPYYGSAMGFEEVLSLLHASVQAFIPHLQEELESR
jgi:low molecular weight protein-tyrosine phosphatase